MKAQNELNHRSENALGIKESILKKDVKNQQLISNSKPKTKG